MMHTRPRAGGNPLVWMKNPDAIVKDGEAGPAVYEFAGVRLDTGRRVLERAGRSVPIYPRAFDRPAQFTDNSKCGAVIVWLRPPPAPPPRIPR